MYVLIRINRTFYCWFVNKTAPYCPTTTANVRAHFTLSTQITFCVRARKTRAGTQITALQCTHARSALVIISPPASQRQNPACGFAASRKQCSGTNDRKWAARTNHRFACTPTQVSRRRPATGDHHPHAIMIQLRKHFNYRATYDCGAAVNTNHTNTR